VQGQPLTGVEPDPQPPPLPGQLVAVEGEAGPLRLADVDGLERGPRRPDLGRVVEVALLLGDRQQLLVDQVQHAPLDQVHVGDQPVHRMGPGVVLLVVLRERQHPQHPPPLLALDPERPRRQRARPHQVELGDTTPRHGRPPAGIGLDDLVHRDQVLEHDRRLPVANRVERHRGLDRTPGDRHHHVPGVAGGRVEQDRPRPPLHRVPRPEGQHLVLRRLLQPQVGEPGALPHQPLAGQRVPGPPDLVRPQPLQRVRRSRRPPLVVHLARAPHGHATLLISRWEQTAHAPRSAPAVDIAGPDDSSSSRSGAPRSCGAPGSAVGPQPALALSSCGRVATAGRRSSRSSRQVLQRTQTRATVRSRLTARGTSRSQAPPA
jgi:hypothetical protein